MKKKVFLYKNKGETPLMALEAWRAKHPAYKAVPATYAGRLDPMAEGKLLVLLGEECKKRENYLGLDKEYEIEVFFDIGSDTGDALGLVTYSNTKTPVDRLHLEQILRDEKGRHVRPYPLFSSKTVNGKPLFLHALAGTLTNIPVPTHVEHIYSVHVAGMRSIPAHVLRKEIDSFLALAPKADASSKQLGADFRIREVRSAWEAVFAAAGERTFGVVKLRVACASGVYMRSLAKRLGEAFGTEAIAYSITRTKIGRRFLGVTLPISSILLSVTEVGRNWNQLVVELNSWLVFGRALERERNTTFRDWN